MDQFVKQRATIGPQLISDTSPWRSSRWIRSKVSSTASCGPSSTCAKQPALNISAKIVGGASMFGQLVVGSGINVGERNVLATRKALALAGVPIIAEDTGLDYGRSVYFHLTDGRLDVRSLKKGNRVL